MLDNFQNRLQKSVENLLFQCGDCAPGDKLLIVHETEKDDFYDPHLARAVRDTAADLGLFARVHGVPLRRAVTDPDDDLVQAMQNADCTVFFARLGDQIRFRAKDASMKQIVSYALDRDMLASTFGTAPYSGFDDLKQLINAAMAGAEDIHVTCPEGTDFRGRLNTTPCNMGDTTRKRFPVSVFAPVPAATFQGTIAQRGFLTGTGSNYYEPYTCALQDTLLVRFKGNRITGFDGQPNDIETARNHYDFVGKTLGIETDFVHSWHVGIHPGCNYPIAAAHNFERWGGGAFGNPRLLHFHTCGSYPPGEISLNVPDPTIRLDNVALWENGRLHPERLQDGAALLARYPDMQNLFEAPCRNAGLGPDGRLSFA